MTNLLDHPLLLRVGELSIYRQSEDLVGRSLGCREGSCSIPQLAKARLEMKRNRVVDFGAYAGGLQMRAQPVALGRADDELVVDMRAVRRAPRERHGAVETGLLEQRLVPFGIPAPRRRPAAQVRQLDAKNRRLKRIEPEIRSDDIVVIFHFAAMLPNRPQPASQSVLRCGDESRRRQTRRDSSSERTRSSRSYLCPPPARRDSTRRSPARHLR